ncbi:MAG TPA: outer membrane protein transport protein, partial [Polyangia bacterium]|nr:outer membrane protein transport protein [Polyangia bacterium]
MPFVDDRGGRAPAANGRRRRRVARLAWIAITLSAATAAAAPLDEPFVGGLGFNGPTSGSVAAIYWNPAALGLVRGTQILISGDGRLTTTTVHRASIDPTTGAPGSGLAPGSATASNLMQPLQYPIGPGAFMGISSDLGGDRFTIGFATYVPSIEQTKFALTPANNEPTRYQALQIDLRNLALVPALSVRFGDDLRLGIAPGFLFSTGEIMFDEDTALDAGAPGLKRFGAENPAAAARYDVRSGNGLGDATFSFTLGGGLFYRIKSFDIGLSYQSRPIGSAVPGVEVAAEQTTAYAPGGAPVTCPTGSTTRCVFGDL